MSVWTHHGECGKLKHSCAGFAAGETPGECHTGAQSTAVVVRALPVKESELELLLMWHLSDVSCTFCIHQEKGGLFISNSQTRLLN